MLVIVTAKDVSDTIPKNVSTGQNGNQLRTIALKRNLPFFSKVRHQIADPVTIQASQKYTHCKSKEDSHFMTLKNGPASF